MASYAELQKGVVKRVKLEGDTGTGKTHAAVQVALRYATAGQNVVYIDLMENSARAELLYQTKALASVGASGHDDMVRRADELLRRIVHVDAKDYDTARQYTAPQPGQVQLFVLDAAQHIVKLARRAARAHFIRQGYYYMGEDKIPITDPAGFELRGYLYDAANKRVDEFIDALITSGADVLICCNEAELSQSQRGLYDGTCDSILAATFHTDERGTRNWYLAPVKFRGRPLATYSRVRLPESMDCFAFLDFAGSVSPEGYQAFVASTVPTPTVVAPQAVRK